MNLGRDSTTPTWTWPGPTGAWEVSHTPSSGVYWAGHATGTSTRQRLPLSVYLSLHCHLHAALPRPGTRRTALAGRRCTGQALWRRLVRPNLHHSSRASSSVACPALASKSAAAQRQGRAAPSSWHAWYFPRLLHWQATNRCCSETTSASIDDPIAGLPGVSKESQPCQPTCPMRSGQAVSTA